MKPLFLNRSLFIKVDDFNEIEEKEVKEQIKKNKKRNGEKQLKKNKLLKKRKQEESNEKEKEMWKRLGEYDKQFQDIKNFKKDSKIMWDYIRKIILF